MPKFHFWIEEEGSITRLPKLSHDQLTARQREAHDKHAAGIPQDVIDDLAANKTPTFKAGDERVYYTFAMEDLNNHFVSDKTFAEARAIFGDKGVVDLIGAIGYVSMLQICLNSAQVDLQPDRKPPFADVRGYGKLE